METPLRSQQRQIKQTVQATLKRIRNQTMTEPDVSMKRRKLDMTVVVLSTIENEPNELSNLDLQNKLPNLPPQISFLQIK